MTYSGVALGNKFEHGRKSGEISISVNKIRFAWPGGEIVWDVDKVEFSYGGVGDSLIFIKNQLEPETTLYTQDKKLLKDPDLYGKMSTSGNIGKLKKHFHIQRTVIWIIVVLLLSPLVLFFVFRTQIVIKIADQVPVSLEQKVGDQLFTAVTQGNKILHDSILSAQLNQVVKPLVNVVPHDQFQFKFFIVEDTVVNAFALPGGNVVINSGLIQKADSWDEIMGVVGHEMAHVTLRHHIRGVINKMGFFTILSAFFGDYSSFINLITQVGGNLESLMYSRKYEYEADNQGWKYVNAAHINPRGMISFFEKLQKQYEKNSRSDVSEILSTHPATAERIKNLKSKLSQNEANAYINFSVDIKSFQSRLKQLTNK